MIKTGNPVISIYTEMTPNPETMKFVANKLLYPGKSIDFADEASAKPSPLAQELFTFPFVKAVFIASNFITLTKTAETEDWQDVIPSIKQFLKEYLEEGKSVVNEEELANVKAESSKWIKEQSLSPQPFAWQEGYGAFSYAKSQVPDVIRYIQNQEIHHRKETFLEEYKKFLDAFDIEWDERYIFKETV